jgi:hypothetical protein
MNVRSNCMRLLTAVGILVLSAWDTPARAEEQIDVGVAVAPAGTIGSFPVSFYSDSSTPLTAGIQVDISYDSQSTPIPAKADGKPDCTANPSAGKGDTIFAFLPTGCSGTSCTSIRAMVVSFGNLSTIPQGVDLFTCKVSPPAGTAAGNYLLTVIQVLGSSEAGIPISMSVSDGFVNVPASTGC